MTSVVERAIEAYGGAQRWADAASVTVVFSAAGVLFPLKGRPTQDDAKITVATGDSQLVHVDLPSGRTGILSGRDVEIRDSSGDQIAARTDARAAFGDLRHWLRWDDIDFTYFAASAWWTYALGPIAWLRDDVIATVVDANTVDVTYAPHLSTHCQHQRFHLDHLGRVIGHDYTAEVVSRAARAHHVVSEYRDFEGIPVATRRRVYPRRLRWPTLVALDIANFTMTTR